MPLFKHHHAATTPVGPGFTVAGLASPTPRAGRQPGSGPSTHSAMFMRVKDSQRRH